MTLGELAAGINGVHLDGDPMLSVTSITHDSRAVVPGALFVALPGRNTDGSRFVPQALAKGAAALGLLAGQTVDADVPTLWLDAPRPQLAHLSARFYGQPRSLLIIASASSPMIVCMHAELVLGNFSKYSSALYPPNTPVADAAKLLDEAEDRMLNLYAERAGVRKANSKRFAIVLRLLHCVRPDYS